jgi:hypothetical protein
MIKSNTQRLISIVLSFNGYITDQDITGLSGLMTEDHTFIDRSGESFGPKSRMLKGWKDFFKAFPEYSNTFERIEVIDDLVAVLGFAHWSKEVQHDPVIWTALIKDNLISEWRVYEDTPENRNKFHLE